MPDGLFQTIGRFMRSPALKLTLIGFLVVLLFTGLALVLFFVLVLSLAEHIGFAGAYVLAALATSLLVAANVWRAMGDAAKGGIMLAVLLILYGLLYLMLKLEDYAVLAGALAGFAMLAPAMFLTLGIDWSGGDKAGTPVAK
jgi:inner membrane protein